MSKHEEWRPVVGYEGLYDVSDQGNVRRLARSYKTYNGYSDCVIFLPEMLLKQRKKRNGYMQVGLTRDGKQRFYSVHRLVMTAFVGESSLTVNHVNEDKTDNRLCNLEYMTTSENVRYSSARPVESYDLITGETIKRYQAETDVREDGFDVGAVNNCCLNKPKYLSHHGVGWRFSNV